MSSIFLVSRIGGRMCLLDQCECMCGNLSGAPLEGPVGFCRSDRWAVVF